MRLVLAARSRLITFPLRAAIERMPVDGVRHVAANTRVEVEAARAAARYESGLGNSDAVPKAQRLAIQASATLWRGLLAVSAAGDIRPFFDEVGR